MWRPHRRPRSHAVAGAAVWAFIWSAHTGQLDDLETPARRILHDDE
jgi:cbb3-type cytochrome oxidase maturation protein